MIKAKHVYIILCILGLVLPYLLFIPWLVEYGLDISLLVNEISSSRLALFAWIDVIITAIVLFVFIYYDGCKYSIRNRWLPVLGTLLVGPSFGLPLYLLMRELYFEKRPAGTKF